MYLIDTDNPDITKAMEDEDTNPDQDKFEYFIQKYGTPVYIDMKESV